MGAGLEHLRVVLVRTRNPLNIGAAARAMSNFGACCLRVVSPYEVAFREARSAVGAGELLARAQQFATVAEAVSDCQLVVGTTSVTHREARHPVHRLEVAGPLIRKQFGAGNVALLFGSEKVGLSNKDLSYCHCVARIPTRDQHSSMNLAQAVAVCLYELNRESSGIEPANGQPLAASADLDRIAERLTTLLSTSGYLKSRSAKHEEKIRRMVRRLAFDEHDAELWLGMLRQIQWKLDRKDSNQDSQD